jgi:hypothetical protein
MGVSGKIRFLFFRMKEVGLSASIYIVIIIIIIIFIIISFMQGIYTYIPETNNVPREYIVAAILLLLIMVPISLVPVLALLCFYVRTFRSIIIIIIILLLLFTAIEFSLGGSSPYTSTDKTNTNNYT